MVLIMKQAASLKSSIIYELDSTVNIIPMTTDDNRKFNHIGSPSIRKYRIWQRKINIIQ